jgi:hypothetical protein
MPGCPDAAVQLQRVVLVAGRFGASVCAQLGVGAVHATRLRAEREVPAANALLVPLGRNQAREETRRRLGGTVRRLDVLLLLLQRSAC